MIAPSAPDRRWYGLAFVEFDDMGDYWEQEQLTRALATIEDARRRSNGRTIAILFIHGWKNNASERSGNVYDFRVQLNRIAQSLCLKPDDCGVVGLYIAWRGDVVGRMFPELRQFTFFDRRNAAMRVASPSLTATLHATMRKARESKQAVVVAIGHSFGAIVLERALTQSLQSLEQLEPPANLIALVNEAGPAIDAKQFMVALKQRNLELRWSDSRPRPLFLSVSSTGDSATRAILPIGQSVTALKRTFRQYQPGDPLNPPGITDQKKYFTTATAHLPILQSHAVGPCADPEIKGAYKAGRDLQPIPVRIPRKGAKPQPVEYCVVAKPEAWNTTPYWAMQIPVEIVPDHSTIFTGRFVDFLMGFLPGEQMYQPAELRSR
ncbi:MAG: hypothetical protein ACRD8O_06475 [Bryobacteraceae bacterium]